ncbi:ATP-binding cassette domain-containing protein [Nakamurella sp. YIM 132087]|uniref:ATP-binding cassette domain-containing protein n=1 Tax=Nakamurella alba TaxID=2665158 RepID=A0A7K1FIW5_9ACTN|nr:ATP-binding cassette domain-containing protein [Nakamurella alba]MTD14048.1 ATP-binding cassette domain-containing protein [Nakamurella alba]
MVVKNLHLAAAGPYVRTLAVLAGIAAPFLVASNVAFQIQLIMLYATAALAMFICMEIAGEFMVGHVVVVAVAAYITAWFNVKGGVPPWWTLPLAIVAGAVAVLILGLPGIRLSGFYLALFSFFAVLIIPDITRLSRGVTGGEFGLSGVGKLSLFGTDLGTIGTYFLCLVVVVGAYLYTRNILRTTWGTRLMALRDSPQALQAAGVPLTSTKAIGYLLSSLPASVAGWLIVFVNGVVFPGLFSLSLVIVLLGAVVAAGRNMAGAVLVGTAIFAGYGQFVGPFSEWSRLGLGIVLLLVIIIAPSGLSALVGRRRFRRTGPADPDDAADGFLDDADEVPGEESAAGELGGPAGRTAGLVVEHVSKSFGGNLALDDVSCEFRPGRIVGLVGANGSGKTTLVNVMTGFLPADSGTVRLGEVALLGMAPAAIARQGLTRTFQIPQLVDDLTVRRNLEIGLLRRSSDSAAALLVGRNAALQRRRDAELQPVVDILRLAPSLLDKPAGALSLGMKRVIEIGRALATGATVFCLDEPAAGLDEAEIERLGRALRNVARAGRTVVLIEHHMRFVVEVCDDILILDRGRVQTWVPDVAQLDRLPDSLRTHMA